jgi:SAM-dependent methyltransferase
MAVIGSLHQKLVAGRRVRVLAEHLAALIPPGAQVLDVGCGDGVIDRLIAERRPDVSIQGIDVLVRPDAQVSVTPFDGMTIPYPDTSFDAVMLVDVFHHTVDPFVLLREAQRVAKTVLIKDHFRNGILAKTTLRFMDWVGNAHHGVALPYNYWSRLEWSAAFEAARLEVSDMKTSLGLYPQPASWMFERGLHFVARLGRAAVMHPVSLWSEGVEKI